MEASLGLTGNLNGVETGLEATEQIHLKRARAISYQGFRVLERESFVPPPQNVNSASLQRFRLLFKP